MPDSDGRLKTTRDPAEGAMIQSGGGGGCCCCC